MDNIFLLEQAIIEELDNVPFFMAFIGTIIDDWLERYGVPFEEGDKILKQIMDVRHNVQRLLEEDENHARKNGTGI